MADHSDEYPPIVLTIRGKQYEAIYSDSLSWRDLSVYGNHVLHYERLQRTISERPLTEDEAKEYGDHVDKILTMVLPAMSPRTLKRLMPGERVRVLRTFFDLEAPATRRLTMDAAMMMLASLSPAILTSLLTRLSATESSQPSPDTPDSP